MLERSPLTLAMDYLMSVKQVDLVKQVILTVKNCRRAPLFSAIAMVVL